MSPNCREVIELLDDYLAGELSPEMQAGFEWHLARCLDCTEYLATYRETIRAARLASSPIDREELPPELLTILLKTIAMRK